MNEYMIVCDLIYGCEERFIWHCKAKDESEAMSLFYKEHDKDVHDIDYIIRGQKLEIIMDETDEANKFNVSAFTTSANTN